MTLPTKLGISFAGLAFLLYIVSLQSQSGLLFLILGIIAGAFILNAFEARRSVRNLAVNPPRLLRGTEGETTKESWTLSNCGKYNLGLIQIRGPWGVLFSLGSVRSQETIHATPGLKLERRGVYPFSKLQLTSCYPFGLFRSTRRTGVSGEFVVYPKTYSCAPPRISGFEPMVGGKFSGRNKSSSGDRFHGVRPFRPTDPVKMIHWPASAKGQGLMVKEFEEELSGRVALVLDTQKVLNSAGELLLDHAARATASLLLAALDQGHQVEYMNLSDYVQLAVPPFADGDTVLNNLARLNPGKEELSVSQLEKAVIKLPRKAALCFVLQSLPETVSEFIQSLATQGRVVSLYLPMDAARETNFDWSLVKWYERDSIVA